LQKKGRNKARSGGIAVTSLDERVPELLGQDTSVVLDVDGLEDAVELELLVVHVPPEVVIADAAVAVAVAGPGQRARSPQRRRNQRRRRSAPPAPPPSPAAPAARAPSSPPRALGRRTPSLPSPLPRAEPWRSETPLRWSSRLPLGGAPPRPRPRVWARADAAAAANADGDEPFFFLAAGGMDISAHQIGD